MTEEHPHRIRRFVQNPIVSLIVGIIALAMTMGAYSVLRSNAETGQVRRELEAARVELAAERDRSNCILDLQADYYNADAAWGVAFTDLVVGLSVRGDVPTLIAALDAANVNKRTAFEAYDQQTGCG